MIAFLTFFVNNCFKNRSDDVTSNIQESTKPSYLSKKSCVQVFELFFKASIHFYTAGFFPGGKWLWIKYDLRPWYNFSYLNFFLAQVWFLKMVSTSKQVTQLLIDKHFELAIRLCNLASSDNLQQKSDRIREIQTLFAFDQVSFLVESRNWNRLLLRSLELKIIFRN